MFVTQEGIDLIKKWEGFRANAYRCAAGVLTIGYGHTSMAGLPTVTVGMKISKRQGEEILRNDLKRYETFVREYIDVHLNPNQFSALVSFTYNVGPGALQRSTLRKLVNQRRFVDASREFRKWNKAGGKKLRGLVRRRQDEMDLFLEPWQGTMTKPAPERPQTPPQSDSPSKGRMGLFAALAALLAALAAYFGLK